MTTLAQEQFVHFAMCMQRLNSAWRTLNAIRDSNPGPLIAPAFRFALVDYAASYTRSDGPLIRNHRLSQDYVPTEYSELHKRILDARDQVHAHSDLTLMEAKLYVGETQGKPSATISGNLIDELAELPNINSLIELIQGTLRNMYADQDRLLQELSS